MVKKKYLIFCLILIAYSNLYAAKTLEFKYKSFDNFNVKGTLYLPDKKCDKIIIEAKKRTCEILNTTDSLMINQLNANNIGYFQYYFPDFQNPNQSINYQIFDYSKDIKYAMDILKKNIKSKKIKIGIKGCSELADACAIYASESNDVDFFISVTNTFVEGYKDTLYVKQNGIKERFNIYKKIFFKIIDDSTFTYNGVNYTKSERAVSQCFNATIDSIVKKIYDYGKYDLTIPRWTSKTISKLWLGTKFNSAEAKLGISNYNMAVDSIICKFIFSKPNVIALYQWQPAKYYSKISIPTFICFGQNDKVINTENNFNSAVAIKELYRKNNFQIEILPNLGHNLGFNINKIDVIVIDEKGKSKSFEKYTHVMDSMAIEKIVMWIKKI